MVAVSTHVLVGMCFNAIFSFCIGLIILNWTLTFYKLTQLNVDSLLMRRPKSVLLFGIVMCIGTLFRIPIFSAFIYNGIGYFKGSEIIVNITLHCTTLATLYILVFRTYLVYYDMKFSEALQDQKWINHIDTSSQHKNWFIQNRNTYGNSKNVAVTLSIIWCMYMIFGTIFTILNSSTFRVIAIALTTFTALTLLSILAYKLPKFEDIWALREETRKLCIIMVSMTIIFFALRFILNQEPGTIEQNIITAFHIFLLFIPSYFSFLWVFKKFHLPHYSCSVIHYNPMNELSLQMRVSETVMSTSSKEIHKQNNDPLLRNMFEDDEWMKLFARHLCHEFSTENFLFFLETHQLITFLNESDNVTMNETKSEDSIVYKFDTIQFASSAPQSSIVSKLMEDIENSSDDNFKLQKKYVATIKIFLKYIAEGSTFCINIPFSTRNVLYNKLGYLKVNYNRDVSIEQQMIQKMMVNNLVHNDIKEIFKYSRKEVFNLMKQSFNRFKQTDSCKTRC
eukprot:121929_1